MNRFSMTMPSQESSSRRPRSGSCTTVLAIAGAMLLAVTGTARAEKDRSRVHSVEHAPAKQGVPGTMRIRIRGTQDPTFTVYKLDYPARVVVDIAGAVLDQKLTGEAESKATWSVNTWAVNQLAVYELHDVASDGTSQGSQQSLVRVVVGMARPGTYRAQAEGRDVVVTITPQESEPAQVNPENAAAAARAVEQAESRHREVMSKVEAAERRKAAAETEAAEAERRAEQARALREREEAAYRQVSEARVEAERRAEQARALREREEAAYGQVSEARAEAERRATATKQAGKRLDDLQAEATAAQTRVADMRQAAAEAERRAAAINERKDATEREIERARSEARRLAESHAQAEAALTARRREVEAQEREVARLARARSEAETELRGLTDSAAKARTARQAEEQRLAELTERRQRLETDLESARKAVRSAQAEWQARRSEAEADLRKLSEAADQARARRLQEESRMAALGERRKALESEIDQIRARTDAQAEAKHKAQLRELDAATAKARQAREAEEARLAELATGRKQLEAELQRAREQAQAATRAEQAAQKNEAEAERRVLEQMAAEARKAQTQEAAKVAELSKRRKELEAELEQVRAQTRAETEAGRLAREARVAAESELRELDTAAARAKKAREAEESKLAELAARRKELETELDKARAEARTRAEAEQAAQQRAREQENSKARAEAESVARKHERARTELAELDAAAARAKKAREAEEAKLAELATRRKELEQSLAREREQAARAETAPAASGTTSGATPAKTPGAAPATASAKTPGAAPATASAKAPGARGPARIQEVDFVDEKQVARVVIAMSRDVPPRIVSAERERVIMEIDGVVLPTELQRTLDTSAYRGPIRALSSYRSAEDENKMRLVVDLAYPAEHVLKRASGEQGKTYYWDFVKSADRQRQAAQTAPADKRRGSARAQSIPAPVVGGYGASSTPITQKTVAQLAGQRRRVYRGTKIDLDLKDVDIHNVMRLLADVGGINVVIPDDVKATVTVRLRQVPWDQALEVVLASKDLWYRREGNLYRIASRKQLDAEDQAEAERLAALVKSEAPEPQIFTLNYAVANEIKPQLEALLSPKGRIEVDPRTNSLIINDVRAHRRRIIELLTRLDTQTPQIQIEARIVEARSTFNREFGVQWGGNFFDANTGLIFPGNVGVAGGNVDAQTVSTGVNAASPDFAVNLPAATGTGAGGALGFAFGSVNGGANITLRLSALEDSGSVRIISAPKITVLNNVEAEIKQGVSIPISVISANGVQTQFVQADLSLKVTPHVSQRDCSIQMELEVEKNEADFVNTGARGDPTILRKEASTTVLVADNETTVIGGIYTRNSGLSFSKVPFFGDLPLVGWFFKNRRENDERTEVLVFITPRITNKAFLRCE
jgi:type IV pilus assembly protein PilQ